MGSYYKYPGQTGYARERKKGATRKCPECEGKGDLDYETGLKYGWLDKSRRSSCPRCAGTGRQHQEWAGGN
jgi:DnaJ-class molecular chaperone|tara:strand:+ start:110 stop:322 length:213 start_codon:yes stop_codon:yes gene_type:complete